MLLICKNSAILISVMELNYKGKTAFVSGAGRGIGKAVALELAKAGCTVLCISKNISSCGKVADEINASGGRAEAWAFDVSKPAEVKDACSHILEKYGAVDIIVNNAGITRDNLLMRMSDEEWDDVISTNLSSCFYVVRNLIRAMVGNRHGRIINIASVSGQAGNTGQANYSAAKAGIIGFTKTLAREFAARNITANVVAPGFIDTDMTAVLPASIIEAAKANIPLKRTGKPDDIAKVCAFLASDEAGYITGQTIAVNGGLYM